MTSNIGEEMPAAESANGWAGHHRPGEKRDSPAGGKGTQGHGFHLRFLTNLQRNNRSGSSVYGLLIFAPMPLTVSRNPTDVAFNVPCNTFWNIFSARGLISAGSNVTRPMSFPSSTYASPRPRIKSGFGSPHPPYTSCW